MIKVDPEACCLCGLCVGVCPPDALEMTETELKVLPNCTDCGWCLPYCPVGALSGGRSQKRSVSLAPRPSPSPTSA